MKRNLFKRGMAGLLSLVMCLTALVGLGTTTAFAAGEQGEVYLISFPRSGDANLDYGGSWGHPNLQYMNGWYSGNSKYTTIRAMHSYEGNICYCIEPGTAQETGDRYTSKDETFWDNLPADFNSTISPYEMKLFIGRIMQYGYTGPISTSWRSQNSADAAALAEAMATQVLIWETIVGERDADFDHVSPGSYDAVKESVSAEHPLYSRFCSYYDSIVASVQRHSTVPSFMSKNAYRAQSVELAWDGTNYTATLTDSNRVLSDYSFSANENGISFSVSGNKLTITAANAPSDSVRITASKTGSTRRGIITWTDGRYAPGAGIQDVISYAQEVSDPVQAFLNLKVSYGSAKIVKTSEDGKVDNLTFTVTGNGVNQTVKTNARGEIQIDNLMPGVYTVTEQDYDKYEPQESRRVTVVSGQVSTVNFSNKLKRGDLQIIKSSEDSLVEGVTFHLYGTSLSGIAVDEYAVTDKNGVATFKDVLISGSSPYTAEEVDTAVRYVVPEAQSAPVKWNEVTSRSFTNILKKFTVTVTKSDAETGTAQGDASLAGAVYGIYKGETLVDSYATDKNGQFTSKEYICDSDWTVREITPSEGYLLDSTVHKVGAEPQLYTVEHNQTVNDVTEQVTKGNIAIIKHTDNGETQIETPESGAEFAVYLKAAGSYEVAEDTERDYLTCDENGFAQTKDMPYGIYTVHQVSGWEGSELMPDFDVFISQNGATYRYLINNAPFNSFIKIVKQDAETGKTIPYAGAGFKIYDPDGNPVTMTFTYPTPTTIDEFYTNAEGSLVTPEKLPFGKGYSIVEVQAPYGYVLDETPVYFDVTEDNSTEESGVTVVKVDKPNMAQKGTITVEKTGEVFFGVSVIGGADESGNELPTIYQPQYEKRGLPGAVYEIVAAEDITTPDGTVRNQKGEVVDTVTTDENGVATSRELYLGKYEVREITAPHGMVLNPEPHSVELVYAGQSVAVTETATSFENERQTAEISLVKSLEANELFGIGTNGELKNISFGLYAAEEIVSTSGTSIPADGLIEIITLNEDGTAMAKTDLPLGSYYVKELATDSHYLLSDTKYPVTFEYAGQDIAVVKISANDGKTIENDLIYGSVSGKKVDENGNALGGALIGLFRTDDGEFTKETAIMTATSAEDGSFSFEGIPYGTWYIREIEQPADFVLDDTVYPVTIGKDGQVVEIKIVNKYIRGNIHLTKVDAEYPDNKLTGATFEVYKDSNGSGKLDDGDELLGTLTEKEIGSYEMKDLFYGRYFVKETKAPEGFVLDTGVYEVMIDTDGKTCEVENKAGVGFINEAMRGNLKIVKTSSDGKIKGFAFRITGANGYDIILETNDKGEIVIEGIRIGDYTVSEVSNSASAMYVLPADKKATVKTGSTTIVEMHNVLRDTPKTGDATNLPLLYALAGLSAVGIAVTAFVGFKKKKKEGND
ncbi:SpaA isopeptide-forming pilin-related protein [Lachnotalea sp. AF33-28]|uniref:SpaA isopeptide-forming pilin-related protein n=1 Tax=Lachnotalea sp. AF33-28 TaxID=2292046 RepID=UPI000E4E97F7|nr:SpaA isopeptide-forming pilin-related protein [Lachnotalea sp. AF33-28]RHP33242.1 TonB-dependent receptor [Lachnotalea sp. AF33-28]